MWLLAVQQMIPQHKNYTMLSRTVYPVLCSISPFKYLKAHKGIPVFIIQYRKSYFIRLWSVIFGKEVLAVCWHMVVFLTNIWNTTFSLKTSLPLLIEERTLISIRIVIKRCFHNTATSSRTEEI